MAPPDGSFLVLTPAVLARVTAHVRSHAGQERCGVLLASAQQPDLALDAVPMANVHAQPHRHFALEDQEHLRLLILARGAGLLERGLYHSHVDGPACLSPQDVAGATWEGAPRFPGVDLLVLGTAAGAVTAARQYRWDARRQDWIGRDVPLGGAEGRPEMDVTEAAAGWARAVEDACARRGSLLVAYSGGVDSAVVLAAAVRALGARAVGVLALSASLPPWEREAARAQAALVGAELVEVDTHELDNPHYAQNPADRCYHCKAELFAVAEPVRRARGLLHLAYGANVEDLAQDDRPGQRAAAERQVVAPLVEAGLGKEQVRAVARFYGLPSADKPAAACLASRFPHGTPITAEGLRQVGQAEHALLTLGLRQVRVRFHGELARIELAEAEFPRLLDPALRRAALAGVQAAGFRRVTLDLAGYQAGGADKASPARLPIVG